MVSEHPLGIPGLYVFSPGVSFERVFRCIGSRGIRVVSRDESENKLKLVTLEGVASRVIGDLKRLKKFRWYCLEGGWGVKLV